MTETEAIQKMIEFAESHPRIVGLSKGNCPEEGHVVFYFIDGSDLPVDTASWDQMVDLELDIYENGFNCLLAEWPCPIDGTGLYPHLGKILWKRT